MTFLCRLGALALVAATLAGTAIVHADVPAPIFRVFLKDGTALASWGEYAEVADHLVLTLPIGAGSRRTYEFVTLPVAKVDMVKTEQYAEAVRAAQFAATRGATEYAALRLRLARQIEAIPILPEASERLSAAEGARQQLLDWAATTHGYRAREISDLLQVFDARIVELRLAAGRSDFSLNLSAGVAPPAPPRLRAAPTANETVSLALKAAMATDDEEVRKALLKRARSSAAVLSGTGAAAVRAAVSRRVAAEARLDSLYRWLRTDVTRLAAKAVDAADTRAIDALRDRVERTDRGWGRRRPSQITGLRATLDLYYEAAAQYRLVLDQWEGVRAELVAYQKQMAPLVAALDRRAPLLRAIQDLASTPVTALVRAEEETGAMATTFASLTAPAGAAPAHALIGEAIERANVALRTRHAAVTSRQLPVARQAAIAAAEARARLAAAKSALARLLHPPKAVQPGDAARVIR
jgi:hypothetical protein